MGLKNRFRKMRGKLAAEVGSPSGTAIPAFSSATGTGPNPAVVAIEENLRSAELQNVNDLANFDACVEACDALAASDSGRSPVSAPRSSSLEQDGGITDCSVLVSPEGTMLFLPQGFVAPPDSGGAKDEERGDSSDADAASAPLSPTNRPSPSTALEQLFPGEEYEAAVVMGSDLNAGGDRLANGFSAKGWSPSAASVALRRSEDALRSTGAFFDQLVTSRMEASAKMSNTCDDFRNSIMSAPDLSKIRPPKSMFHTTSFGWSERSSKSDFCRDKSTGSSKASMKTVDLDCSYNEPEAIGVQTAGKTGIDMLSMSSSFSREGKLRSGPLFFPGATLHAAAVSLEQYFAVVAENDAYRWALASAMSDQNGTDGGLTAISLAAEKAAQRSARRDSALYEAQKRADEAEAVLTIKRAEAAERWEAVEKAEADVQRIFEEKTRERSRERERRRQLEENERQAKVASGELETGVTQAELWELVSQISSEESSFSPIGLPDAPAVAPTDKAIPEDKEGEERGTSSGASNKDYSQPPSPPLPSVELSDIEVQLNIPGLRASAMEADDNVEDAAAAFLNILSTLDTTRKSARVAAEAALLSAANSQAKCIRAILDIERASIEERLRHIEWLDRQVQTIDVRSDLDAFIEHDKRERPGGATRLGDDDDGGIASALAVLNSHSEGRVHAGTIAGTSGVSTYEGWGGAAKDDNITRSRGEVEKAVEALFAGEAVDEDDVPSKLDRTIKFLVDAVGETSVRARACRASTCYALNSQRSVKTEVAGKERFDGLCSVFNALLSGCDREESDIANAKMCMMLSQTFYMVDQEELREDFDTPSLAEDRKKRIYVKSKLIRHPLFSDEDFWVQALYQCVTEALTGSGVMSNFEKSAEGGTSKRKRKLKAKWYELTPDERFEAASQVHAVIFAQLGALSHSMVEFGCDTNQACAFVRRLSIQHQLPLSQRTMLLQHLMGRQKASPNARVKGQVCGFDEGSSSTEKVTPGAVSSAEREPLNESVQGDHSAPGAESNGDSTGAEQSLTKAEIGEIATESDENSTTVEAQTNVANSIEEPSSSEQIANSIEESSSSEQIARESSLTNNDEVESSSAISSTESALNESATTEDDDKYYKFISSI